MQDRPTTTHYSTSSSTNKQGTMRFLNKQWFFSVVIITIPSLSNIHQSAAFYQKHTNQTKKDIYNHKEIDINFHKQKVKGLEQNRKKTACSFLLKSFNKKDRRC